MFGWEFPPHHSGGLGVACYGLSKALSKRKVVITFVLPKKLEGIKSDFFKMVNPDFSYNTSYIFDSPLYPYVTAEEYGSSLFGFDFKPVYGRGLLEEVFRYAAFGEVVAEKEEFDVIHAHDWLSFGAGIRAKVKSGKPLVAHVHATEFDRGGGSGINQIVYSLEREGMEKADKVIAVSGFTKNIITKYYGIPEEKVEVVHNGIEIMEDSPIRGMHKIKEAGKKIVLFVGRLTLQKGPDYFIRAARRICDVTDDVYFVVSGSGDMQYQLIEQAASLKISDRVLFAGFLKGEELKKAYQIADLFVMPSVSEPFGITPLESLVNGTPVLISKQSGISEVITHALKANFWDVDDIANKTLAALNYDSLSSCLLEYGKKEAANITWEGAAEKCIKIYETL